VVSLARLSVPAWFCLEDRETVTFLELVSADGPELLDRTTGAKKQNNKDERYVKE